MTARIRNIAGVPGDVCRIPLAGTEVEHGDTFEVSDEVYLEHEWAPDLFEVVDAPKRPDPDVQPAKSASTEAWREWALSHGATVEDVEDMGRGELIEKYGQE